MKMFEILQLSKCTQKYKVSKCCWKMEVIPQIFNLQKLQYEHSTIKQDMPVFLITHAK